MRRVLVKQRTRLYGLEIETKSVGYGRVNAVHATEIFIREALVNDTVTWPFDFLAHNRRVRETHNAIAECSKPVIAAVNGPALGAGFGLVMASDIWVASETAVFSMPEINVGLAGGVSFLQRIFGQSRARRMFFTGMQIDAAEMYRLGLVEACLPPAELLPYAMAIAHEIAGKSPIAVRLAKEAARLTEVMPLRDAYRYEQGNTVALSKTEDAREAQMAFLEKRKPVYKGR